jgi:uncharacterized protein (TIGR02099 family)
VLFAVVVLSLKYALMPNIGRYQGDIISRVAAASGMDVSATAIRGGWTGATPYVELENVQLVEREGRESAGRPAGTPALKLPKLRASISWWSLLAGQIRFAELIIDGPELVLSRRSDGLIYFAGRAVNQPTETPDDGQLLAFFLEQPGLEIRNASLDWQDDMTPGAALRFTELGLIVRKSGASHEWGLRASPPPTLARQIQATGDMRFNNDAGRWTAVGRVYASATDANLKEFRQHVNVADAVQSGLGNMRVWLDLDTTKAVATTAATPVAPSTMAPPVSSTAASTSAPVNAFAAFQPVRAITADVNFANASVQLEPGLAPLNLVKLAGRINYKAEQGGFSIGSKALELRTREGAALPAADFSLKLLNQAEAAKAKGEATGNGIDLKVMAALIEFFPVGKDVRALVARYSPRGLVRDTTFSWDGYVEKPRAYKLKASVADFAVNAYEKTPGVAGFSGEVEGDNNGGVFKVASKDFVLDAPEVFLAPLKFQQLTSDGKWNVSGDVFELAFDKFAAANSDIAFELNGRYSRFRADGAKSKQEKGPGTVDLRGKITSAKAASVYAYLPKGSKTQEYLKFAVQSGEITSADLLLKGELYEFPFLDAKAGQFKLDLNLKNVDFRYAEGWPVATDITGVLTLENTKLSGKVDSARFYNAPLKKTTLLISDLSRKPAVLGIIGEVDARAEDASRYLRESPLINNVGAFTKFVMLDGPGKLNLDLSIPLGTPEENAAAKLAVAVRGDYTMMRGNAKLALGSQGLPISNVTGSVTFNENGIKSNGLQGVAFGNPMSVSLGMQEGAVIAEFSARADVTQLRDLIPFKMPQQVSGTADFRGRVTPNKNGMDVTIESSLAGVSSNLPYPLAKRSDEQRPLRVTLNDPGQPSEKIRLTVGGIASVERPQNEAETRIDARFLRRFDANGNPQSLYGGVATIGESASAAPVPEGLWLEGSLPQFDFDAWRRAIDNAYPAVAAPAVSATGSVEAQRVRNDSIIAGFDVKLGSLTAYGRPFKAISLKGRHGTEDWRFVVDSKEASGDFTWRPNAFDDRGAVRARLKTLSIAEESPVSPLDATASASATAVKDADFPALDIVADSFTLKDRWLGKLELRATPQVANWRIDQLVISNGHATVEMDGLWQRYGDPERPPAADAKVRSRTVMNLKVEGSNLNALLGQFGFSEQLRGGVGKLEGRLSWPGHTYDLQIARLSGNFKVEATNGAFSKVQAGAGKLLGLMSLQSLPRRITLDFRDIFSNGFAFDRLGGDVRIENGVMFTENFEIVGPAAEVKMEGDVALPSERANLVFTVQPKLDETVALGAGLFTLNPLIGVAVFVGQKVAGNPFEKMFSYKYAVTGPWDNPEVERIGRSATVPANSEPSKASAAEATPEVTTAAHSVTRSVTKP